MHSSKSHLKLFHPRSERRGLVPRVVVPILQLGCVIFLQPEVLHPQLMLFDRRGLLLSQPSDVLEGLCVLRSAEYLVKLFLQRRCLSQRPVAVLLVDEHHVLEDRLADSHHIWHGRVDVGALATDAHLLPRLLIDRLYDLVEIFLLELTAALLRQLEGSGHDARLRANVAESKLDLRLDLGDVCHLRVVDESLSGPRARRKLAGRRHLQALDHRLRVEVDGNGAGVRDAVGSEGRERRRRTGHPSAARSEILATLVWVGDYRRTVFPAPLRPTISVRGFGKMIAWSLSGLKLRMPLMSILSTEHMAGVVGSNHRVPTRSLRRSGEGSRGGCEGPPARYRRENGARACPDRNARPLRYYMRRAGVCRRLRWPRGPLSLFLAPRFWRRVARFRIYMGKLTQGW